MEPGAVMSLQEGVEEAYVLFWPPDAASFEEAMSSLAVVIMKRVGGLLLAVPVGFIPLEELQGAATTEEDSLIGPFTTLSVPAVHMEEGGPTPYGSDIEVQVVDFADRVTHGLVKFSDAQVAEELVVGFTDESAVVPDPTTLLRYAMEWAAASAAQRANFYSADEGAPEGQPPKQAAKAKAAKAKRPSTAQVTAEHISRMASLLPAMAAQLTELQQNQISLQQQMDLQAGQPQPRPSQMPVSMSPQQFAGIVGAPPKTKGLALSHPPPPPPSKRVGLQLDSPLTVQEQAEEGVPEVDMSPLALAMLEQSRALTAIMAHLAQGDPLLDTHASGTSTSSRGAQGREKLQRELSDRTGSFFLTVMQNMFKRMKPASSVPKTIEELASTDLSMVHYLERFGGYGNVRDMGICQYALSFVVDLALKGDLQGLREHLALLVVAIEQYAQDGKWDLGFMLTLLEDPPPQMWSYRNPVGAQTGRLRAFAPLCPQRWATIQLAYLKEIDFIHNRRQETTKKEAPHQPSQPGPKRKGNSKGKASLASTEEA